MERRFIPATACQIQIETRENEQPHLSGYGAVFFNGTPGTQYQLRKDAVERILPGAFDRIIASRADLIGMFNHSPDHVLGRTSAGTMVVSVDAHGLRYDI